MKQQKYIELLGGSSDGNVTFHDISTNAPTTPILPGLPPAIAVTGDVHVESFIDKTLSWTYNGTTWILSLVEDNGWDINGNELLTDANRFGTNDAVDVNMFVNGSEQASFKVNGSFQYAPEILSPVVDIATNTFTFANHGLTIYDGVFITSTGTLPAPLVANTRYFPVGITANTFQLSATSGGAAIDITTAGTGTIKIASNLWGNAGYAGSFISGTGNRMTTVAPYAGKSSIIGNNNTVSSLGQARIYGSDNTVTGGFGTAFIFGSGNGQGVSRGTILSGNGMNVTLGNIHSGGGQATTNTGYHNDIDPNAQGAFTMGGGVDADLWGSLTRHSHASNGGYCSIIGEMSRKILAGVSGTSEIALTSLAFSPTSVPNGRLCFSGRTIVSGDFDFLFTETGSDAFWVARRRITWIQKAWTQGSGNSADVTANSTTDIFTSTAHGFTNGQTVYISATEVMPAGLNSSTPYFIISATANTFRVSLTSGGAAVNFTTNGTGIINVSTIQPPIIQTIEQIGTDHGSNAGAKPATWNFSVVPFNRIFTTGQVMFNGVTHTGANKSSFPYLHVNFNGPASTNGYIHTCQYRLNVVKF